MGSSREQSILSAHAFIVSCIRLHRRAHNLADPTESPRTRAPHDPERDAHTRDEPHHIPNVPYVSVIRDLALLIETESRHDRQLKMERRRYGNRCPRYRETWRRRDGERQLGVGGRQWGAAQHERFGYPVRGMKVGKE